MIVDSKKVEGEVNPPKELYAYHATSSFAHDISMPYLSYFAVRLGASFELIAWIQSTMNLLPNALQYFWGWISDTKLVRTYWIIGGSILASIALYFLSEVKGPYEILFLVMLYSVALSIINPTWSALQGDWMNPAKRGSTLSRFHVIGGLTGLVGSLIAVYLVYVNESDTADSFRPLFAIAAVATFVGGLILIRVPYRDPDKIEDVQLSDNDKQEYSDTFRSFVNAQAFYTLNMSLIWPLFAMILIDVLEVDNMVLVAFSLVGAVSESTPKLPDAACSRMAFSWFSRRTAVTAFLYGSLILGISSWSKTGPHFCCSPSARYIFLSPKNVICYCELKQKRNDS